MSISRNKRSVTLDLKRPAGREVLQRLIGRSDVLVENFRPGTMDRLGFGYEQASAINARLIYASISGFGQTGPRAQQPAFDQVLQGMGGVQSLTGPPAAADQGRHPDRRHRRRHVRAPSRSRRRCTLASRPATGQHIDTSMLGGQVALLTLPGRPLLRHRQAPGLAGNRHGSLAPYETFKAQDGDVNVACGTERMWQAFCERSAWTRCWTIRASS